MPLIIYQRYCVIEIWRLYPKSNRMLGDIGGSFLSERYVPLKDDNIFELKRYYLELMKVFVEALEEESPSS